MRGTPSEGVFKSSRSIAVWDHFSAVHDLITCRDRTGLTEPLTNGVATDARELHVHQPPLSAERMAASHAFA
jgi:hypothetical protein